MTPNAPTLPSRRHRVLAASTVLALAISLLIGMSGAASAADSRTWTFSGVTLADGGQMTGTFDMSDTGVLSALHITTSGGNTPPTEHPRRTTTPLVISIRMAGATTSSRSPTGADTSSCTWVTCRVPWMEKSFRWASTGATSA